MSTSMATWKMEEDWARKMLLDTTRHSIRYTTYAPDSAEGIALMDAHRCAKLNHQQRAKIPTDNKV